MTHPLTPREKVRKAIIDVMKPKDADITLGRVDTCTDATLTALASGSGDQLSGNPGILKSGDHAELARSVGKAIDANIHRISRLYSVRTGERRYGVGGQAAATDAVMAVVSPLLAEIAALRDEHVHLVEQKEGAEDALFNALSRATEAERKLAEADQVIRDIAETPYTGADWPRSRAATYVASKEAERG